MTSDEVTEWDELIQKVARGICRDYPDSNVEDMSQFLWAKVLEKIDELSVANKNIIGTLKWLARKQAGKERSERLTISDEYAYRTSTVGDLYEVFFDQERWMEAHVPEDARSELGPVQLEIMSDISRGYDRLPVHYKRIIFRKYALNDELDENERRLLSKAKSRTAEIMNAYVPPNHKARRVITNATARYTIDGDFQGDR